MSDEQFTVEFGADTGPLKAGAADAAAAVAAAARQINDGLSAMAEQANTSLSAMVGRFNTAAADGVGATAALNRGNATLLRERIEFERQQGQVSAAEAHALSKDVADAEYRTAREALEAKRALLLEQERDLVRVNGEIEQLALHHELELKKIDDRFAQQQKAADAKRVGEFEAMFRPIESAADRSVMGMIRGTMTARQAVANLGQSIVADEVSTNLKRLSHWAATELAKTGATEAGVAERGATETAGAAESLAISAATGIKDIAIKAYQAAAGAYAAIAAIPYVGPVLAPVAAAGALAAVIGIGSKIASAEGGYDIPAGVNPITQLHAQEMVLPAQYANVIRGMAEGGNGGGGSGGGDLHVHVNAIDSKDMARALMDSKSGVYQALQAHARNLGQRIL
jgi:hypothetical protein